MPPRDVAALVATLAALGAPDRAAGASVQIALSAKRPLPEDVQRARIVVRRTDAPDPGSRHVTLDLGGSTPNAVDVPPGTWAFTVEELGLWSPEVVHQVPGDGGLVTVPVWPAGHVALRPIVADGSEIRSVTVVFDAARDGPSRAAAPSGVSVCPVIEAEARCTVPAGGLDIQLRPAGLVPHYRWSVDVAPRQVRDLGRIAFLRGASVAGFVQRPDMSVPGTGCLVELRTSEGGEIAEAPRGRKRRPEEPRPLTAAPGANGFFQITGVAPGEYRLVAAELGYSAGSVTLTVFKEQETALKQPVFMGPGAVLELQVAPALDPAGAPWTVHLIVLQGSRGREAFRGNARPDGRISVSGLSEGVYSVRVESAGRTWFSERVRLEHNSGAVQVNLPYWRVQGALKLGSRPLGGRLVFGRSQGLDLAFDADREGRFGGFLPRRREWSVQIEADDPPVRRNLGRVSVEGDESTGEASMTIQLPDTVIRGRVVDEQGQPVAGSEVEWRAIASEEAERLARMPVDDEGRFELHGVTGTVLLTASTADGRTSDDLRTTVGEATAPELRLVLRKSVPVKVRVVGSDTKAPVAGALVWAQAADAAFTTHSRLSRTDINGEFELDLPSGRKQIQMAAGADGYALHMSRRLVSEGTPLTVELTREGGQISIELPAPLDFQRYSEPFTIVRFQGTQELLIVLVRQWVIPRGGITRIEDMGDLRQVTLRDMAPGDYAVCLASGMELLQGAVSAPSRCASGHLSPGGFLSLKVPGS